MAYSETIRQSTAKAEKTLGNQMMRWAIKLNFSVISIANYTGATRQTIYNWGNGTEVTPSYRTSVTNLLRILQTSSTVEEAMKKCKQNK